MTAFRARASALALAGLSACMAACGADLVLPPNPVRLTVEGSGRGSGTVATTVGPPPTLTCRIVEGSADSGSCSAVYAVGTRVTLSAAPAEGNRFTGWAGGCSGTSSCELSLADSTRVTAGFESAQLRLTIVGAGTGNGTVSSAPGSVPVIDCVVEQGRTDSTGCEATFFLSGTVLTLTATPERGSNFSGWGGDCSGTSTCEVALDRSRVVSVAFVPRR
jgi:hypothetical protein